jgi:hypothetical protein
MYRPIPFRQMLPPNSLSIAFEMGNSCRMTAMAAASTVVYDLLSALAHRCPPPPVDQP